MLKYIEPYVSDNNRSQEDTIGASPDIESHKIEFSILT